MPLRAPSLPLPTSTAIPFLHPCRQSVFLSFNARTFDGRIDGRIRADNRWKNPKQWEGLLIRSILAVTATTASSSSSADFRSPESASPVRVLARQLLAQEPRKELVYLEGEAANGSASNENVDTSWSILQKVARILAFLLLGFGALFTLRFPALANPDTAVAGAQVAGTVSPVRVSEIIASGWAGVMAGCLHTLTGPDHLAALAPLCIGRARSESALIGALWGCGHNAGQVIFGLAFLLLKGKLHIELVRTWGARVVGVTLLAIGAVGLKEAQEVPVSVLAGEGASSAADSGVAVESKKNTRLGTFATGVVYGLQPDALIMILPALALPSRLAGAAYLGMFLIGTVVAMGSYTAFIGSCGQALEKRVPWITRRLTIGSSLVAIAFGICVLLGEFFGIYLF